MAIERDLKQISENRVDVIGTLVEVTGDVKTSASGKDYIRGTATIKSNDKLIKFNYFSMKLKADGSVNKLFNTYSTMSNFKGKKVSVQGSIDEAKVVRDNQINRGNSLTLRFIGTPRDPEAADSATFKVAGYVYTDIAAVYAADGATVDHYSFQLRQANYKKDAAVQLRLDVDASNAQAVDAISQNFPKGTTAVFSGELNFDVEERKQVIEQTFGLPEERISHREKRSYYVTSGNLVLENGYSEDEIKILDDGAAADDKAQLSRGTNTTTAPKAQVKPANTPRLI